MGTKPVTTQAPGPWVRWRTKDRAERAIRFIETYCVQIDGANAGQPMKLAPFQKDFIRMLLKGGTSAAVLSVARGAGKSTLLAAVSLWALFDDVASGPPSVPIIASTVAQGRRSVFAVAAAMREANDELVTRSSVFSGVGLERIQSARGGEIFTKSADAAGLQGLRPSLAVIDEVGFLEPESWDSLVLASMKRPGSVICGIGTVGLQREDSALWTLEKAVIDGKPMPGFELMMLRAPDGADPDDEAAWAAANPLIETGAVNLDAIRSMRQTSTVANFRRFIMNTWVEGSGSWLGDDGAQVWAALLDPWEFALDAPTWLGIDIGLVRDSSAVAAVQLRPDGRRHVRAKIWTPQPGEPLNQGDIAHFIRTLARMYDVQAISYDPRLMEETSRVLLDEGLPMIEVPQNEQRMVPVVAALYDAIVTRSLSHDDDPLFAQHILNAVPRHTANGFTLGKRRSTGKIDAAVAAALAVHASMQPVEPEVVPLGAWR